MSTMTWCNHNAKQSIIMYLLWTDIGELYLFYVSEINNIHSFITGGWLFSCHHVSQRSIITYNRWVVLRCHHVSQRSIIYIYNRWVVV